MEEQVAEFTSSERIEGVVVVRPEVHSDERGRFIESYRRSWFALGREMVQGNRADRQQDSLVGLHYHLHQADYWYVTSGRAQVILHDLRVGSPTERGTESYVMGDDDELGLFIPPGVAHGFLALTDLTLTYLVDGYYNPNDELGVAWDDPEIGAKWEIASPVLSPRDLANPSREAIPEGLRPRRGLRT